MSIKIWGVAMASVVAVAGCMGGEEETTEVLGSEICQPETFQFLVGQDKSALEDVTVPEMVRVMQDGSPMTMDFHENRLNVFHDEDGKIVGVTCG